MKKLKLARIIAAIVAEITKTAYYVMLWWK